MSFLLDTNIISEATKRQPNVALEAWLERHRADGLYLSVITIGELQQGIARLPASQRRADLENWLPGVLLPAYADWILPLDTDTLLQWGTLTGELIVAGRKMPLADSLLAATALRHGLTLVTRNTADFNNVPVPVVNPWNDSATEGAT